MYCYQCGKELPANSAFCAVCGEVQNTNRGNGPNPILRKKKPKVARVVLLSLFAVAICSLLLFLLVIPSVKYANAIKLANNGEYKEAYEIFKSLDEFRDAAEQASAIKGDYVADIINSGVTTDIDLGDYYYSWTVLDIQNDRALLIGCGDLLFTSRHYNDTGEYTTWESCFLRQWLNDDLFDYIFNESEKSRILETVVTNADNPWYGTDGGNDTRDRIFLLSIDEFVKYLGDSNAFEAAYREFQSHSGLIRVEQVPDGTFWLRSPGADNTCAALGATCNDIPFVDGGRVDGRKRVCPVLWFDLK